MKMKSTEMMLKYLCLCLFVYVTVYSAIATKVRTQDVSPSFDQDGVAFEKDGEDVSDKQEAEGKSMFI